MASSVGALLVAAVAWGAVTDFEGKTAQGRPVLVRVGGDGLVRKASVRWLAHCQRQGATAHDRTVFFPPFRKRTKHFFADRRHYRFGDGDFVLRVRASIYGRHGSPKRWHGQFRVRVRVFRKGELFDRCRLPWTRWSATR